MAKKANAAVGTCPCPISGCSADRAPLFQFVKRAGDEARARKAGKYYIRCPDHGWIGFDGAAKVQEHIRANGKLNEGHTWEAMQDASAATSSAPNAQAAATAPATKQDQPKREAPPTPRAAVKRPTASTPKPKAEPVVPTRGIDVWDL